MSQNNGIQSHRDPWINLPEHYMAELIRALEDYGIRLSQAWMDPGDRPWETGDGVPRDATIVWEPVGGPARTLVWDEETGLRFGRFVAGRQGVPTEMADVRYLGGGLLPAPREAVHRILTGVCEERVVYRSRHDVHDGFDDLLRAL